MNQSCHRLLRLPSLPGWSIVRAACVLWFTITTCGIPGDFIFGSPRETRCCCSPVKRQAGTCCCSARSAMPVQPVTDSRARCCQKMAYCANDQQTAAKTQLEAKSSARASGLAGGTTIEKTTTATGNGEIAPCGCGTDEQLVWGGPQELRLLVMNQFIWRSDQTQFFSVAVEQTNDSPHFAPPVPPPIAAS